MALTTPDPRVLRSSQAHEVTKHLRHVLQNSSEEIVTQYILGLIERDSIAPAAFAQWLGVAQAPETLRAALVQTTSIQVRTFAFKKLKKVLSGQRWQEIWQGLGGVSGWLGLLSDFSVQDVKQACRVFAHGAKGADTDLKRKCFTELFVALLPRLNSVEPSNGPTNKDHRKLRAMYQRLIPACTRDVVSRMVAKHGDDFNQHRHRLLLYHADTLQALAIHYVFDNHPAGERWLSPLLSKYPQATTAAPGVSASMRFSLNIFERLTTEDAKAPLTNDKVIRELAEPLLKKALKKKINWSITQHIVDLCISYLDRHPDAADTLDTRRGGFVHMTGKCWSSKPDMFTDQFNRLLALQIVKTEKEQTFVALMRQGLSDVPISRRYALLRFYCQGLYQCDLDNEADIKAAKLPPLASTLLNFTLSPEDALALFTRMRSARGDNNLVDRNAYCYGNSHDVTKVDVDMWHCKLLFKSSRYAEADKTGRKHFGIRKTATMSSARQEQRALNARSAVDFAILSGSLVLCMEAHQWAKRFVRDPLTARELYRTTSREGINLLSGIPKSLGEETTCSELRIRVESANKIISFMFETTCLALREPSFNRNHFQGVLALFASVVQERRKQAPRLKSCTGMSDEEVYQVLWVDTLKMLIAAEEKGLSPGYERLCLNTVRGVLNYTCTACIDLEDEEPATWRFFDELAKARDELWRKHRLSIHPATAALPGPFPRGLPVQHLIEPYVSYSHSAHAFTPFIASRMKAAVFPDRTAALVSFPEDQEMREAVGTFVDDYFFALRTTVPQSLSIDERKRLVHHAWSYAISTLSEGRFTSDEATQYWKKKDTWNNRFPEYWPGDEAFKARFPDWPLVPEVENFDKIEEWNPVPAAVQNIPERRLEKLTYIDVSKQLLGRSNNATVLTTLQPVGHVIPAVSHAHAFSSERIRQAKANPAIREGQIMLALSYIDNLLPKLQLFNQPSPTTEQELLVRYPAVYLDGEFVSNILLKDDKDADVFKFLRAHLSNVPPSLLAQAALNAYETLSATTEKESGYINLEHRTLELIRLLTYCDRPSLASDLVVRIALDRPSNSSWHRQLLSPSFFRRLPATAAQHCISTFSKAIISRIEQQTTARAGGVAEASKEPNSEAKQDRQGLVKVTTVKLLAQLLGDTECVPEPFALSILSELISKASHIDIRCAAVSSLLGLLNFVSFEQTDEILTALQTIIPIAGNLRERRLVTDAEWADAENTLELPELDNQGSLNETAPILWSLFYFLNCNPPGCPQFQHQAAFVTRIILPIITSLKYQTGKWTSLCLKSQGFDFAAQQDLAIPQIPRDQQVMYELLRCAAPYLPISFLDEFVAYCTFNIAPPHSIATLNKKLSEDVAASGEHTTRSWLTRYALGTNVSARSFKITTLLDTYTANATASQLTGEITVKAVQAAYLKLYTVILLHDTETLQNVNREQGVLWSFSPSSQIDQSWETKYKPLVEAIILYVESLHTREWERDPDRHPSVLPDTFTLRMHLLRYAAQHSDHPPHSEEHCAAFATRVAKLVDQISHKLYHNKFLQLKASLKYVRGDNRLRVACHLGDISKTRLSWLTLPDHLRVELAASLLYDGVRGGGGTDALAQRVELLRQSWRASESEEVRREGYRQWPKR